MTQYTGDFLKIYVDTFSVVHADLLARDDSESARALTTLGIAYAGLGDAAKERDLLQRALAIQEREYGPEHREVAATLADLGKAYGDLGDAVKECDLLQRALAIQ